MSGERETHEWYGPCDGFGPRGACSACTGLIQRADGGVRSAVREYPRSRWVAAHRADEERANLDANPLLPRDFTLPTRNPEDDD